MDRLRRVVEEGQLGPAPVGHAQRRQRRARALRGRVPRDRCGGRAVHGAGDQARCSTVRSARTAPGCSSRTPTCPSASGLNTYPLEELERTAASAPRATSSCACTRSATGRTARCSTCTSACCRTLPDGRELRWRIEHAQHLAAADIPRFAQLGVIASMQGVHCTSDGPWVPERLGAGRAARRGAYVWRELLDSGAGSATAPTRPVEDVDPIANFYASVTRRSPTAPRFIPSSA